MSTSTERTSPGDATFQRFAFEQAVQEVVAQGVGRYLIQVHVMALAEMRRRFALTASGDPTQPFEVSQMSSLFDAAIEQAIDHGFFTLLDTVPPRLGGIMRTLYQTGKFLDMIEDNVSDYLYSQVLELFGMARKDGMSPRRVEDALDQVFAAVDEDTGLPTGVQTRSQRLARTSATSTYNRAMIEQLRADGYTHKLWVSHHDEVVRDSHLALDGVSVPLDQPFMAAGGMLQYPGEPGVALEEVVNCRCVMVGAEKSVSGIDWDQPVLPLSDRLAQGLITIDEALEQGFLTRDQAERLWEEALGTVVADGSFGYNPEQARAPKGTPIGGQWIMMIGGILRRMTPNERRENGDPELPLYPDENPDAPQNLDALTQRYMPHRDLDAGAQYMPVVGYVLDNPALANEVATSMRETLSKAAAEGVTVSVSNMVLDDIADHGGLANIWQANDKGRGFGYLDNRDGFEREVMGVAPGWEMPGPTYDDDDLFLKPDPVDPTTRPIYGHALWESQNASMFYYGDTEVRLRPEVLTRTSWTLGDSLDSTLPPLMTHEIATASDEAVIKSGWGVIQDWGEHTVDSGRMQTGWDDPHTGWAASLPYVEAQVHGGVALSDIASINLADISVLAMFPDAVRTFMQAGIEITVWDQPLSELQDYDSVQALLASAAYGYNPEQARAPKGTPIGGQWIDTPTGLLSGVYGQGMLDVGDRSQLGDTLPRPIADWAYGAGSMSNPYYRMYDSEYKKDIAENTRDLLGKAAKNGVHIAMSEDNFYLLMEEARIALEDGEELPHYRTMAETVADLDSGLLGGEDVSPHLRSREYIAKREMWEGNGLNMDGNSTPAAERPIYGYGLASENVAREQGYVFGPVTLVLKDEVANRTFWTHGDGMDGQAVPILTENIATADAYDLIAASAYLGTADKRQDRTLVPEYWETYEGQSPYIEAQVMGGVRLDDIKEVIFSPLHSGLSREADVLAELGIPYRNEDSLDEMLDEGQPGWFKKYLPTPTITTAGEVEIDLLDKPNTASIKNALWFTQTNNYDDAETMGGWQEVSRGIKDYFETEAYSGMTFGSEGYTVDIHSVDIYDGTASIDGTIRDQMGNVVGTVERDFETDTGALVVHHDYLRLDAGAQGHGFGTEFSAYSEALYREMGVERIYLTAALDKGGYTWARAGYQWRDNTTVSFSSTRLREAYSRAVEEGNSTVAEALENLVAGEERDIENITGRIRVPTEVVTEWIGTPQDALKIVGNGDESIMWDTVWEGEKYLNEVEVASGSALPWYTSRERSDILFEFCRQWDVDYLDATWPRSIQRQWDALDEEGASAALVASGDTLAFNPEQARAPKGTPIGGQWIDTPSGLMESVAWGREQGRPFPLSRRSPEVHFERDKILGSLIGHLDADERAELADVTRRYLKRAASAGVKINVTGDTMHEVIQDGRIKTLKEVNREVGNIKSTDYNRVRFAYERDVVGLPTGRRLAERPIYGWAEQFQKDDASMSMIYGGVEIHLKPEVMDRTTLTIDDSLNRGVYPIWANEIDTASDDMMLAASIWASDRYYSVDENGEQYVGTAPGWEGGPGNLSTWYTEAQVHGGVSLDDIAEVVLEFPDTLSAEDQAALADLGIAITYRDQGIRYD